MSGALATKRSTDASTSRTCDSCRRPRPPRSRRVATGPVVHLGHRDAVPVTQAVDDRADRGALGLQRSALRNVEIETDSGCMHRAHLRAVRIRAFTPLPKDRPQRRASPGRRPRHRPGCRSPPGPDPGPASAGLPEEPGQRPGEDERRPQVDARATVATRADTCLTCGSPTRTAGRLLSTLEATTPAAKPRAPPSPAPESASGTAATDTLSRVPRARREHDGADRHVAPAEDRVSHRASATSVASAAPHAGRPPARHRRATQGTTRSRRARAPGRAGRAGVLGQRTGPGREHHAGTRTTRPRMPRPKATRDVGGSHRSSATSRTRPAGS